MQYVTWARHTKAITEAHAEGATPTLTGSQRSFPNHPRSNKSFPFLYFSHIIFLMAECIVIKELILEPASMASDPSSATYLASWFQASHRLLSTHQFLYPSHLIKWNNSTSLIAVVSGFIGLICLEHCVISVSGILKKYWLYIYSFFLCN